MSFASDLVDALLAEVVNAVPTATTRNAITEGWFDPTRVDASDFPYWEGYGVTAESTVTDAGQVDTIYTVSMFGLRASDEGDAMHADIDAIRAAVAANYSLGGLAILATAAGFGVDEVTDQERSTNALIEWSVRVFQ